MQKHLRYIELGTVSQYSRFAPTIKSCMKPCMGCNLIDSNRVALHSQTTPSIQPTFWRDGGAKGWLRVFSGLLVEVVLQFKPFNYECQNLKSLFTLVV